MVKPWSGRYAAVSSTTANCCIGAPVVFDRNVTLRAHPVGALPGDRPLGQLVAQPDLELRAVERSTRRFGLRDEELPALLAAACRSPWLSRTTAT